MEHSPTTEDVFGELDDLEMNLDEPSGFSPIGLESGSWDVVDGSNAATSSKGVPGCVKGPNRN